MIEGGRASQLARPCTVGWSPQRPLPSRSLFSHYISSTQNYFSPVRSSLKELLSSCLFRQTRVVAPFNMSDNRYVHSTPTLTVPTPRLRVDLSLYQKALLCASSTVLVQTSIEHPKLRRNTKRDVVTSDGVTIRGTVQRPDIGSNLCENAF